MKPEIKRILFASDLSETARRTFAHAVTLAVHHGAVIVILHVMESLAPGTEERVAASFGETLYSELKSRKSRTARDMLIHKKVDAVRARDALRGMCEASDASGADVSAIVADIVIVEGDAAEEILSFAHRNTCDLIVMGMRRRKRFAGAFAGSTVRRVMRRTDTPVLIVPTGPAGPKT